MNNVIMLVVWAVVAIAVVATIGNDTTSIDFIKVDGQRQSEHNLYRTLRSKKWEQVRDKFPDREQYARMKAYASLPFEIWKADGGEVVWDQDLFDDSPYGNAYCHGGNEWEYEYRIRQVIIVAKDGRTIVRYGHT